jgi:hypothetical protein
MLCMHVASSVGCLAAACCTHVCRLSSQFHQWSGQWGRCCTIENQMQWYCLHGTCPWHTQYRRMSHGQPGTLQDRRHPTAFVQSAQVCRQLPGMGCASHQYSQVLYALLVWACVAAGQLQLTRGQSHKRTRRTVQPCTGSATRCADCSLSRGLALTCALGLVEGEPVGSRETGWAIRACSSTCCSICAAFARRAYAVSFGRALQAGCE